MLFCVETKRPSHGPDEADQQNEAQLSQNRRSTFWMEIRNLKVTLIPVWCETQGKNKIAPKILQWQS